MSFYRDTYRALHEADAPALMNPAYWAWITARSSDERLLYLTSRGDTDALKRVLLQIERGGVQEADLPFEQGDIRQQIVRAQARPLDLAFLAWAFRFSSLEELRLSNTQVSDVTPLAGLTRLEVLGLSSTKVSDLTPLAGLTRLDTLGLSSTKVSGLTPLAGLTRLKVLVLSNTEVSDLTPLASLTQLRQLSLNGTAVPPAQIDALQAALPNCWIIR